MKQSYAILMPVKVILLVLASFYTSVLVADVSPEQLPEVEFLLNQIKTSGCTMERNGEKGTGEMAHDHIKFKYDYYRDDIKTTEDFIRLSATKSVLSGKYYMIYCDNGPGMRLGDWLFLQLEHYRKRQTQ